MPDRPATKVMSCTIGCSELQCPEGTVCVWTPTTSWDSEGNPLAGNQICAAPCTGPDDCLESTRAGACSTLGHGQPSICSPLSCWPGEWECPSGYECVDVEIGDPSSPGWCQRI